MKEERKLVTPELLADYRRDRKLELVAAGAFLLSALPVFWIGVPLLGVLRYYFWITPLVIRRGAWLLGRTKARF